MNYIITRQKIIKKGKILHLYLQIEEDQIASKKQTFFI